MNLGVINPPGITNWGQSNLGFIDRSGNGSHFSFTLYRKGHKIYDQQKRMGIAVDWDRESFTMSEVWWEGLLIAGARWITNNHLSGRYM